MSLTADRYTQLRCNGFPARAAAAAPSAACSNMVLDASHGCDLAQRTKLTLWSQSTIPKRARENLL
jgi:hypothetical protein